MKLQIGTLIIALYILVVYFQKFKIKGIKKKWTNYDTLLLSGIFELLFDAITAYTVNHLDTVSESANLVFHTLFLISVDTFLFALLLYVLHLVGIKAKSVVRKFILYGVFFINVLIVIIFSNKLEYVRGKYTNYSMGIPVYTCYILSTLYLLFTIYIFLKNWRNIEEKKRLVLLSSLTALTITFLVQLIFP